MKVAVILKAPYFNQTVIEDTVIYADGAYKHKDIIGDKNVLAVVGDFDSLGKAPKNENIVGLSIEKDYTDGEICIRHAVEKGAKEIVIYGAYGGKIEHVLGNIALLKIAKNLGVKASIKDGDTITELIDKSVNLSVKKGGAVSIIPYGGDCKFNGSSGLYYPLNDITLTNADTRGISNVSTSENISVEFKSGEALIIYEK